MEIAIIGGGVAGLTAAYRLSKDGVSVTLFERDKVLGGLAGVVKIDNFLIEKYYHHIFTTDFEIINLIDEIGLKDKLMWLESRMGLFYENKIHAFGTPGELFRFKHLSFLDKLRFGATVLFLKNYNNWRELEKTTAIEWMRKYAGENVCKVIWEPLLVAKFGKNYQKASMSWLWGKIKLRGSSRSKGGKKERLGYLLGSFGLLIDKLENEIISMSGTVKKEEKIVRIDATDGNKVFIKTDKGEYEFDKAVSTVAYPVLIRIAPQLSEEYKKKINQVEYASTVFVILILKNSFTYNYWENISDNSIPFGGIIEHTNFIRPSAYNNKNILYISNYLYRDEWLYKCSDKELIEEYSKHLKKMNPNFSEEWIEQFFIFRDEFAQPIVTINYSQTLPNFETPIKNLFTATMAQIYPEDRGMNYSVKLGNQIADIVLKIEPIQPA